MGFFSEYKLVNKLLQQKQQVVVFAESRHYYQYFERLISDVLANTAINICYITADAKDPLLEKAPERMQVLHIKTMLGFLLSRIKADVLITTTPDLGNNLLFKRSPAVGHYIYIFHAAVSTHQQYKTDAFYKYDTIFCTGKYQKEEIRAAEKKYSLPAKQIVEYGYPLFEAINKNKSNAKTNTVLIAPSWFEGCIFDTCIEDLLNELKDTRYSIVLRSHPEYEKRRKKDFKRIQKLVAGHASISMDDNPNVVDTITRADILITDRSGIAFEFAFGVKKPVLFIDTVLKQSNPQWKNIGMDPVENSVRIQLGVSLGPKEINLIHGKIKELETMTPPFSANMQALGAYLFYNSEESYRKGWEYVAGLVK
ncbi:MAG TPA: CDP-glycerol glycerophosphotransferase family protein [Chitinophagaceae bacterium]|nr:CDP-glycerol glycerophosphotransferase family protein [Chitinophagaceae bacterium]